MKNGFKARFAIVQALAAIYGAFVADSHLAKHGIKKDEKGQYSRKWSKGHGFGENPGAFGGERSGFKLVKKLYKCRGNRAWALKHKYIPDPRPAGFQKNRGNSSAWLRESFAALKAMA